MWYCRKYQYKPLKLDGQCLLSVLLRKALSQNHQYIYIYMTSRVSKYNNWHETWTDEDNSVKVNDQKMIPEYGDPKWIEKLGRLKQNEKEKTES